MVVAEVDGLTIYRKLCTCNEFIELMALNVRNSIVEEIKQGNYFALIVDSTPDASHTAS